MVANLITTGKVMKIIIEEIGHRKAQKLITRLKKETVPSGNQSYDETIRRLEDALWAE